VPIEQLRSAVGSLDLARLESMKDAGAAKSRAPRARQRSSSA
jgi:hypothetical protein